MPKVIPKRVPDCAKRLLQRHEWFDDIEVVDRARLAKANWIARLLSSPTFAQKPVSAITLGRTIYFRQDVHFDPHSLRGLALLAHELKHVEQYEQEGLPKFYAKYLWDYAKHRYGPGIQYEAQASEFETEVKAHLDLEFQGNPGVEPCVEMVEPHTPNLTFVKKQIDT